MRNVRSEDRTRLCSTVHPYYNRNMSTISVQEIQRDPLAFLQRVEAGESFLVVKGEQAVAEVRPVPAPGNQPRPFGLCAGQLTVPADFDNPLPDEILKEFEGP
jgi:antitoxin (DNA-binding transcriptional repressor) of toxin-antitoxin stability system